MSTLLAIWAAFVKWLTTSRCSKCGATDLPPAIYIHGREVFPPCIHCGNDGTE